MEAMGYDPFDVREVEPRRTVEVEEEDTARVDYTVKIGGTPALLFQSVQVGAELDAVETPLSRHLGELEASFVALTNGIRYRFYADLGEETADKQPFFEFDLLGFETGSATYLERITKQAFDTDEALAAAFQLKYTRLLRRYLAQKQESPDKHFVRFLAAQVHEGDVSDATLTRFRSVVKRLFRQIDMETRRTSAGTGVPEGQNPPPPQAPSDTDSQPAPGPQSGGKEAGPEERAGAETSNQELPAERREGEEPKETASGSVAANGQEKPGGDRGPVPEDTLSGDSSSNGTSSNGTSSNGTSSGDASADNQLPADEGTSEKETESGGHAGERADEEPDGGSSLAEEFANKVVGNSNG
jgi:hypothetical protein